MVVEDELASLLSECQLLLKQARDEGTVSKLPTDQFRTVLDCCKKLSSSRDPLVPPLLSDLAEIYIEILSECCLPLENQLLASTAFCHVLSLIQTPTNMALLFSKNFLSASSELFQVKLLKGSEVNVSPRRPEVFKLCLCHGLLQLGDTFWTSQHLDWKQLMFAKILPLIESHTFTFTELALPAFKCLRLFLAKVNQSNKLSRKIPGSDLLRIARIVLSNWENPMSGVREQNGLVFEAMLDSCSDSGGARSDTQGGLEPSRYLEPVALMELVFTEQSWTTKSKYFMLSSLMRKNGASKVLLSLTNDIMSGLLVSLAHQHLVSAGAELYKVCLEEIDFEQWQQIFLHPILSVLTSSDNMNEKQNVFNYWMSVTVRRFKASLQIVLENLVECQYADEEHLLYPIVSCYRLGRKEGYEKMQWTHLSESLHLRNALKQSNDAVRMQAFTVVCVSCKSATVPTDEEFDLVQSFLVENINCNNAALRHSLLASFATFLTRMTDVCQHILDKRFHQEASHAENRAVTRSMMFLDWLYTFLKSNLEVGTNYQRRYTSLEIYKIVLSYLTDESVPTLVHRKNNLKNDSRHVVMKHAIRVGKWSFTSESSREMLLYCISDPSDDVRQAAATLVVTYFKISEHETIRISDLYKKALGLCSDALFYYTESGALLIQVLTCLVYKCGGQSALKTFGLTTKDEKVSSSLLSVAQVQGSCLRGDLLKAAAQGAPLHGVLRALDRLVLDSSSPEQNKLSEAERLKLITLLETTVSHLLNILSSKSENISEYAPSFGEMGEALESVIVESSITVEESDKHRLSPSYQLLLNCIWLNLRMCCNLASGLVASYGVSGLGTAEAWRCADICLSVLKQCRHKGAIESAGSSLGACVRVLSEAGLTAEVQAALGEVLVSMSERSLTSSTRAAGQVTMLHRLVASDSRPTKPLVEVCVNGLVEIVSTNRGDVSQALQTLTCLVLDSSLTQELARHYHSLTMLALDAISSPLYPIRNGGLTLLGALVPKLVGQRRRHDEDSTGFSRLPYEELYLHCPALVKRLIQELAGCEPGRLLAVLTLVSSLTVGILTCVDRSLVEVYQDLVDATRNLLNSRWCAVRSLAAIADAWLARPTQLGSLAYQRLWSVSLYLADPSAHRDIVSENQLHGFLLNTKHIVQRFDSEKAGNAGILQQSKQFDLCYKNMDQLSTADFPQISYVCRSVLSELSNYNGSKQANRQIEEVIAAVTRARSKPHSSLGIYSWTDNEISKIIANCPLDKLVPSLYTCLIHCDNHELHGPCINALSPKISDPEFKNYASEIINILGHYVAIRVENVDCSQVLEIILDILIHYKNSLTGFSAENLINALTSDTERYRIRLPSVSVTVLCALLGFLDWDYEMATQLSTTLIDNCDSAEKDEETRFDTARGLALLAEPALIWDGEDTCQVKARLWTAAVILLQDEHPKIRIEASKFASKLSENCHKVWNPHVSLEFLFRVPTLSRLLPIKQIVNCLWSNLKCRHAELLRLDSTNGSTVVNPFEVGISNIYAEHVKIVDMSFSSLYDIVTKDSEAIKVLSTYEIFPYLKDLEEHCLKLIKFYGDYLLTSGAMLTNDWYVISKKICYMHKIINYANNVLVDKELEHLEKIYHKLVELKI